MSISSIGGGGSAWPRAAAFSVTGPPDTARRPGARAGGETGSEAARPATSEARLSEAERRDLAALKKRDREVRAHEMAHIAAGAGLVTGGASYTYQTGPDGQRYAIGGEVGIDVSPGRTPEETLTKAERIRAAALAPAEPSGQDRQVASQATRMASAARLEIARREFEQNLEGRGAAEAGAISYRGQQAERAYAAEPSTAPSLRAAA